MKKILLLGAAFILFAKIDFAQLTVAEESDDAAFVYSLAGPGISVSDIVRNCAPGASGYFNSLSSNVGIDSGILLTSGTIINAIGANNSSGTSWANDYPGDADLDAAIPTYYTYDACTIEFNMTVAADTVKISYVFGSEEYLEFVASGFNDVFAFWVSGPGIDGAVNIATIPGTTDAVAINNVNNVTNSEYYVNNGDGFTEPYSTDPYYIQYDGMTVVMEGKTPVTAGETYHMKIAIADAGDEILDSGVFLKTGSLGSLRLGTHTFGDGEAAAAIEKCSNGYIKFTRYVVSDEPLTLNYHIAGSAMNGVDYTAIPEEITIPGGDSSATLTISPLEDAVTEGPENIMLYLYNPESDYIYDSVEINISDAYELNDFGASMDALSVDFSDVSEGAASWLWEFGDGTTSTEQNPSHEYAEENTYTVCLTTTNAAGCSSQYCKQINVRVSGIDNNLDNILSVYPNPVTDNLYIEVPSSLKDNMQISVLNVVGEEVISANNYTAGNGTIAINCSSLAAGFYFAKIVTNEGNAIKQFEVK